VQLKCWIKNAYAAEHFSGKAHELVTCRFWCWPTAGPNLLLHRNWLSFSQNWPVLGYAILASDKLFVLRLVILVSPST